MPDVAFGILVAFSVGFVVVVVGLCFWWRMPLLTCAEGIEVHRGWVTKIECQGGFLVEVTLSADMTSGELPLLFPGAPTRLVHSRSSQRIPRLGQLVTVQTELRYYRFQRRSLNWVMRLDYELPAWRKRRAS